MDCLLQLRAAASYASFHPLYLQVKEWLCCETGDASYNWWLSWTVAGTVTAAYCLLLTARIMSFMVPLRKGENQFMVKEEP